ncbi:olfactory receptor 52B2-like [Arapaima gigas]
MSIGNQTSVTEFFIVGFPGLHSQYYGLTGTIFFFVYFCTLLGNAIFLILFSTERNLHKPMYFIILNLVVSDVLFSTTTLPKIIARYWFQAGTISFTACFVQMFFIHFFGTLNSFTLLIMALDRYVAICYPLRYPTIITNSTVLVMSITSWVLSAVSPLMIVIRAYPLPYCASNTIIHCYCDHVSITTLACTDRTPYAFPAFVFAMVVLLVPLSFIIFSYCAIIAAVLRIASTQGRLKTLSTCSPQLIIIALYFVPRCFVYFAGNVGITFSTDLRIAIIVLYSLLPPMVNPLIYCFRTKEVKKSLIKTLKRQEFSTMAGNQSFITEFFIMGFPGIHPTYYGLIATICFLIYFFTLLGNAVFLALFITDRNLHKPVYFIILKLVVSDVLFSTTTLPKIIARYWFQAGTISFTACFVQMFFIHFFGTLNAFILLIMALDRYVAICFPFRYPTIMTKSTILILSIASCVMATSFSLTMVIRAYPLPYCVSKNIIQCYCDHNAVTTLACIDRLAYVFPALVFAMVVILSPLAFIIFSYCAIIVAVFKIASTQGRLKTLSTCSSQLIIIALYFVPRCFVILATNVGITFSTDLRIAIIMLYSLLPPMVNPLIYCFRTKEVKESLSKRFKRKTMSI